MATHKSLIGLTLLAFASLGPSALADKGGHKGGHGGHGDDKHGRRVEVRERERDDKNEVREERRVRVREGEIREEHRVRHDGARRRVRTRTRFHGLDANGDGVISRAEWRGSARSFAVLDKNGDGVLSGAEVRTGRRR